MYQRTEEIAYLCASTVQLAVNSESEKRYNARFVKP